MTEDLLAGLRSRHILVGPLPPPVHGFARAMEGLAALLEDSGASPLVYNLAGQGSRFGVGYHLERMRRVYHAVTALVQERRLRGEPVRVHIGCDGGGGLIYTLLLTAAARLAGCSLHFHHHSYASLKRRRLLMSALVFLGGRKALHVTLRKPMADALRDRYGDGIRTACVSNAAFVTPASPISVDQAGYRAGFTIGMLGNLDASKGLHVFLALADVLQSEIPEIRILLAGPIAKKSDRTAVARRVASGAVEWIGPVTGEAKSASFYRRIDLLAFPSHYAHEAEPMVLLEAMAHGVPIIATDRGCIRDLTGDAAVIVQDKADFVAVARRVVRIARTDRVWLQQKRATAWRRFQTERAMALQQAAHLLDLPLPVEAAETLAPYGRIAGRAATQMLQSGERERERHSGL